MILVDTNIISELMRPQPHKHVVKWLSKQPLYHFIVTLLMFSLNPFFQFSSSYEFKNPHILFFSIKNAYFVNRYFCKAQKF